MRKGRLEGNMDNTNRPPLKGAPSNICTTPSKPSPFNSKILISGFGRNQIAALGEHPAT